MEYHLACLYLPALPADTYICTRCQEEVDYKRTYFDAHGVYVSVPASDATSLDVNYSPAKPLAQAWREMQTKGLMLVSQLLDYQTMRCVYGCVSMAGWL